MNGTAAVDLRRGDCFEVLAGLPDGSVDAVLTDPPYGTTDLAWDAVPPLDRLWAEWRRVLKPGGAAIVFGAQPFTTDLINSNRRGFRFAWKWLKRNPTGFANAKRRPLKVTEDVVVFCDRAPLYRPQGLRPLARPVRSDGRKKAGGIVRGDSFRADYVQTMTGYPRDVLEFPKDPGGVHPTQKPVALLAYLLETHTRPGDRVLDSFAGSGSTAVACVTTGRRFVGSERDEGYLAKAKARIAAAYLAAFAAELDAVRDAAPTN